MARPTPEWFDDLVNRPSPYAGVHVTAEFVIGLRALWADPVTRAEEIKAWEDVLTAVRAGIRDLDWPMMDSFELVRIILANVGIEQALPGFLPAEFIDLPPKERLWLFLQALRWAPANLSAMTVPGLDEPPTLNPSLAELILPYRALAHLLMLDQAAAEYERRAENDLPGVDAARVRLAMQGFTQAGLAFLKRDPGEATDELQRRATAKLPTGVRDILARKGELDHIGSQVWLTIDRKLGRVDGFEAAARAVKSGNHPGEYNIVPRSISNDITKQELRDPAFRLRFELDVDELADEETGDEALSSALLEQLERAQGDRRFLLLWREATKFQAINHRLPTQEEWADACHKDVGTIRRWLKDLQRPLST